jgi:dTDP-4-amino-4,6-dideoxygalactose transaminase
MYWAIPRGRISHPITTEVKDLIHSTFFPLRRDPLIRDYEEEVGKHLQISPPILFPFARTGFFAILELLRLPAGSKILMPTITIKPLLDVALHFNLIPILVDLDVKTGCWEPKSLENALKQKPKVALLTYLFGVVPNLEEILPTLFKEEITVIEDFSQAFGARFNGRPLGTLGDFGICSTSSTKTFDTYGGALVFFRNDLYRESLINSRNSLMKAKRSTLIKKILKNLVRNIGTNKLVFGLITFPLILAINSRSKQKVGKFTGDRSLSPLSKLPKEWFEGACAFQAKIGIRELSLQIDKDRKRIAIANRYSQELHTLGPRGDVKGHSVYWQYISVEGRPISFRDFLNSKFVDCATTSLVKLSELSNYGLTQHLSGSDAIYSSGVYLPCYHQLSYKEQTRVISAVRAFYEGQ